MSKIEWTDVTWNPTRGCSVVSKGCTNCYAMKQAHRFAGPGGKYEGLTNLTSGGPVWTGEVRLVPEKLEEPLHWRKPRRCFVNSMSDLFHEDVPFDFIDRVFAIMALCPQHTFQILTKRPERMLAYLNGDTVARRAGLPNVWLGVSVEDQATADERVPLLLNTPAVVRWVSCEPLLGPMDFTQATEPKNEGEWLNEIECGHRKLHWIVVGGETGPKARPCDINWIKSIIDQNKAAEAPVFVKQLGAEPRYWCAGRLLDDICDHPDDFCDRWEASEGEECGRCVYLTDRKGADMNEWPEDLRVRKYPIADADLR